MKKTLLIFLIFLFPTITTAQLRMELDGTVDKEILFKIADTSLIIAEGTSVTLKSIYKVNEAFEVQIFENDKKRLFSTSMSNLNKISFEPSNIEQFWQKQALDYDVYKNILNNGVQYKLRKELEQETIDYINYTESNNLIFKDSYIESYLYSLVYRIYPRGIHDGRFGVINIKILKSTVSDAFIFSNGTMFLTTGLLSTINSEAELIGIMAHEISHFVLDHSIININKAEKRLKRAKFWATFATGVAAVADAYTAVNNEDHIPGAITLGTAAFAYSIASELYERMGLKYSIKQEIEADKSASELMKYINIDPTALSSALLKIKNHDIQIGNYTVLLTGAETKLIDDRVKSIGKPTSEFNSIDYDKTMSSINSFNAINQLNNHHLQLCLEIVNKNIKAEVATENDYILLAMITIFRYDNKEKNKEALSYINKAKTLEILPSINIYKQEAIILIRLEKYDEAKIVLNKYLDALNDRQSIFRNLKSSKEWIIDEKQWTIKMIYKLNRM